MVEYERKKKKIGCGLKSGCVSPLSLYVRTYAHTRARAPTPHAHSNLSIFLSWQSIGENLGEGRLGGWFSAWNHEFLTEDIAISTPLASFRERSSPRYTRRLRLYELQRKEPLYNPRWPPPRRGLLLANTKQEAPPWLTARDGMIYWDFCLFAPCAATNAACLARYLDTVGR